MTVPYEKATSGGAARDEIVKLLRKFGCESVGFMDDFQKHSLILAFTWRGHKIQLEASAKGWAEMFLRENPYTHRHRIDKAEYQRRAMDQGAIAVNSILRDWVKGQVTAVECGVLSFGAVFMPYMLTNDDRPLYQRTQEIGLLQAPKE